MKYYCNICKKDITQGEYSYSKDKFGRPLCLEHQKLERRNQARAFQFERQEVQMMEQEPVKKSLGKKVAVTMIKAVKKGVKKVADFSKKQSQKRKWKTVILGRMEMSQLKQLCFEQNISTKKTVEKEGEYFDEPIEIEVNCSKADLVSELRSEVSLDAIISFANRNHINIKDTLVDMAEWEVKDYKEMISKNKKIPNNFYQSLAWGKIRKLVLKRDNYKCKHCGALANNVDHISSARIYPEIALDLDNLISSCDQCHIKRHGGKEFTNG